VLGLKVEIDLIFTLNTPNLNIVEKEPADNKFIGVESNLGQFAFCRLG
jgi:hypothetical protein